MPINGLLINLNKTKYIIFNKFSFSYSFTLISFGNECLENVNELKLLGLIVQNNLRWTSHRHAILTKIVRDIRILLSVKIVYLLTY